MGKERKVRKGEHCHFLSGREAHFGVCLSDQNYQCCIPGGVISCWLEELWAPLKASVPLTGLVELEKGNVGGLGVASSDDATLPIEECEHSEREDSERERKRTKKDEFEILRWLGQVVARWKKSGRVQTMCSVDVD